MALALNFMIGSQTKPRHTFQNIKGLSETSNSDWFTMAANFLQQNVQASCVQILSSVRSSNLNFSCQETPFSIYLTIRISPVRFHHDSDSRSCCSEWCCRQLSEYSRDCGWPRRPWPNAGRKKQKKLPKNHLFFLKK